MIQANLVNLRNAFPLLHGFPPILWLRSGCGTPPLTATGATSCAPQGAIPGEDARRPQGGVGTENTLDYVTTKSPASGGASYTCRYCGVAPGVGSGVAPGVGSGVAPGVGSGVAPGVGSGVAPGVGSEGVGSGEEGVPCCEGASPGFFGLHFSLSAFQVHSAFAVHSA
jgi:hypothetical protein